MLKKMLTLWICFIFLFSSFILAQEPEPYSQLDPNPYDPQTDPNIDMFISSWKESMPRHSHGSLVERDIFTKCQGDPLHPTVRGAILTDIKRFSHASLAPQVSTTPTILEGEQEIFYIDSGKGIIKAGSKTGELYEGVGVLMPPGIEFAMTNTGDEPLTMYIIVEYVPEGFKTRSDMLVRDENIIPLSGTTGHWCHVFKRLIWAEDGLTTLVGMGPCSFDPMTMGQPHSHVKNVEEIWFSPKDEINILLGKQLRKLPPGSAYKVPPNGITPHSNINVTDKSIKLFWFMKVIGADEMAKDGSPIRKPE